MVDEVLDLTTFPGQPEGDLVELGADAWAALVAAADVDREHHLRADLSRDGNPPPVTLGAAQLDGALDMGLDRADSRWAVTALGVVNAVDLRESTGRMAAGLDELARAGLVAPAGVGFGFTVKGAAIVEALVNAVRVGSITPALVDGERRVRLGELTVIRSPLVLLLGIWNGLGEEPKITLIQPDASSAVQYIAELMAIGRS